MSEEKETQVFWEHPKRWLYVIIPVQVPEQRYNANSAQYDYMNSVQFPLLNALCPQCGTVITMPINYDRYNTSQDKIVLPQYGCVGP